MTRATRPPPKWLGLYCGNQSLDELGMWFAAAREHGFTEVQPAMCWSPLGPRDFAGLRALLDRYRLHARCVGVYNDLYKWDGPLQWENTTGDMIEAVRSAAACGFDRVVCWSGSAARSLGAADDRNRQPEAIRTLHTHALRLLPELAKHGVRVLFEPWRTHVLPDENATAAFCSAYAGRFGAVVDPPNFLDPSDWPRRGERIREIFAALGGSAGMIHLKDMCANEDGSFGLPQFGRGQLDATAVMEAIQPWLGKIPVVAEHVAAPSDLPDLIGSVNDAVSRLGAGG